MMLAVTEEEARELGEVLDERLREMRLELARTDDRAYRSDLRDRYEHLERLYGRLKQLQAGEEVFV